MAKKPPTPDTADPGVRATRRGFLAGAGGLLVAAGSVATTRRIGAAEAAVDTKAAGPTVPFFGVHQAGIATPQQSHTYFAALDIVTAKRGDVIAMLKTWTKAAANLTAGRTAMPLGDDLSVPASNSGEAASLAPSRLTITFGFGAGLFVKDGKDRFGLAAHRPEALIDLPRFNGDQLIDTRTGGDLSIQACADDPQVAFHAVRQLVHLAYGAVQIRWAQSGFLSQPRSGETPRNLLGFKDGTQRPADRSTKCVWVGNEGADWMRGGSYVVARRIRMALEHWDRTAVDFQEQVIGRHKYSGAPLGKAKEFDNARSRCRRQGRQSGHPREGPSASGDSRHQRWRPDPAARLLLQRRRQLHRRALAAVAPGHGIRCRPAVHRLSARSAHRLRQDLRQDGQARHAEPVRDPHGKWRVRLPARRRGGGIYRPAPVRDGIDIRDIPRCAGAGETLLLHRK